MVFVGAAYLSLGGTDLYKIVTDFLWNWQTLIAGLTALAGALYTVGAIRDQIQLARDQEEDRRERKQFADRTAMPSALAELIEYAKACLNLQKALLQYKTAPLQLTTKVTLFGFVDEIPDFPTSQVSTLQLCLETTDRDKREPIAEIVRRLQIQHYRLDHTVRRLAPVQNDGTRWIITVEDIANDMVDTIDLLERANNIIPYARGLEPAPPEGLSLSQVQGAANFNGVDQRDYPIVHNVIRNRYSD